MVLLNLGFSQKNNDGSSYMSHSYLQLRERFDKDKLYTILKKIDFFKSQLSDGKGNDKKYVSELAKKLKKYLKKSYNGISYTTYRQNYSKGRYSATNNISLQGMCRKVRHSIAEDYFVDIDIVNCHPVILLHLCKTEYTDIDTPNLERYVNDRENVLKELKVDRDLAKQIYISLMNEGSKDYNDLKYKSEHIQKYKKELNTIRKLICAEHPEKFAKLTKHRREVEKKDYAHKGSFINHLLCEIENKILMKMFEFFGEPDCCVLCHDGIMLPIGGKYNLEGCEEFIQDECDIKVKLKIKKMNDGFDFKNVDIVPYKEESLNVYSDFNKLIGKNIYLEKLFGWGYENIRSIENHGNFYYITKNKVKNYIGDKHYEETTQWTPIKSEHLAKSLNLVCNVHNSLFQNLKGDEPEKYEDKRVTDKYQFNRIGGVGKKSFLQFARQYGLLQSYNKIDFVPYLKRKGIPDLGGNFNIFTPFPFDDENKIDKPIDFTKSHTYNHIKIALCAGNEDEFEHFMDFIADMIQDPSQIKGTAHLFYSRQGAGKGMLCKFLTHMLGTKNVLIVNNTDSYFGTNFNIGSSNKILKVFEEVSEKGNAFKNHNRLKAELTAETERIEPKGIDAYTNRNCARALFFTNNQDALYVEGDDRRYTLHRVDNKYNNNFEYFKPIWKEIGDQNFLRNAFNWFVDRKYNIENVLKPFETTYKKEQKVDNLSNGLKFLLEHVTVGTYINRDNPIKIRTKQLKNHYREWCYNNGIVFKGNALVVQLRKLFKVNRLKYKEDGNHCYGIKFSINSLEQKFQEFLKNDNFKIE